MIMTIKHCISLLHSVHSSSWLPRFSDWPLFWNCKCTFSLCPTNTLSRWRHFFLTVALWHCCTGERIVSAAVRVFFCTEQWFCSSRTHLMPHWNPIITTMEQNELLLTWSAASWFRMAGECGCSPGLRHGCTFLFLSRSHSPHCIEFSLPARSPPPTSTYTQTHCDFRHAGHFWCQSLWPIRVWTPLDTTGRL